MKILNKNSTGSRSRALTEREVMQELTPGDKNYGKISVGTDGTYEGEVLIGKDSDVQKNILNSHIMSKAQFDANATARREQYAGSGFICFGDRASSGYANINTGIHTRADTNYGLVQQYMFLGYTKKPIINVNGTLQIISAVNFNDNLGSYNNTSDFGNATIKTSKFNNVPVITDSVDVPAMKQGDMAILTDLNRNIQADKGFYSVGNPYTEIDNVSFKNDSGAYSGATAFLSKLVPDIEYELTCTKVTDGDASFYYKTNGWQYAGALVEGVNKKRFTVRSTWVHTTMGIANLDDGVEIKDISIKQVSETPIVALQDIDAGDIYSNVDKFEARDSVSRQDLVFLESWHEDIADKNIIYPFGNIQYRGGNTDGLSGITEGTFTGADTYSLFSDGWQEPGELIGKGYVWSELSLADKIKLASNPENNIYRDGEKWIQVRYRIRVMKGLDNNGINYNKTIGGYGNHPEYVNYKLFMPQGKSVTSLPYAYANGYFIYFDIKTNRGYFNADGEYINPDTITFGEKHGQPTVTYSALPIALVQRRNAGIWHETFNPEGCARVYSDGAAIMSYLAPEGTISSMADCFDHDLIATIDITDPTKASKLSSLDDGTDNGDTYKITGTIVSEMSGRPDGIYVDEINERDVEDLRMSAHERNYDELREEFARKAVAGEIRGKEETVSIKGLKYEYEIKPSELRHSGNTNGLSHLFGEWNYFYNGDFTQAENVKITHYFIMLENLETRELVSFIGSAGTNFLGIYDSELTSGKYELLKTFVGKKIRVKLYEINRTYFTNNNLMTWVDIIGDPRNLNQRIKLDITEDTVVDISRNDYVLCTADDQTGGTAGHYYRYIAQDPIANVHTSDNSVGDANATDGHFDLSQDDTWLDLGTDGVIGGYPTTWLEHGVDGAPLLVTESGESMLPVVGLNTENIRNDYHTTDILGFYSDTEPYRMYFKASRKGMGVEKFLVRAKDGHWVTFTNGTWANALEYFNDSANRYDNHVLFNIGNDDTLTTLGYSSMEEALDLMLVKVYYKTKSNFLKLSNNNEVKTTGSILAGGRYNYSGKAVPNFLINKVNTVINGEFNGTLDKKFGTYAGSSHSYGKWNMNSDVDGIPKHNEIKTLGTQTSPIVKYFDYLTISNNRARLQFVFKELKYDTDSSTWGDDNKFQITNKVSTLTDENGNTVLYGQKSFDLPYFIK